MLAELIAGETEDREALVVMVESTQTCVLGGEASSAGDVHDEQDLIAELVEVDLLAGDPRHLEVMDG